jgi:DnaJ-class molecular chaperone
VSEAHTVLSDATKRRQYDASRPMQGFGQQPTGARAWHPYASSGDSRTASSFRQGMGGRLYGLDEEVWLAHHYGPNAAKYGRVHRNYGMNIVEDRIEKEEERITKCVRVHGRMKDEFTL